MVISSKPYPEEFSSEAVKQVTERGHPWAGVAKRIVVPQHSLYQWIKMYDLPESERHEAQGSISTGSKVSRKAGAIQSLDKLQHAG